MSQVEKRTFSGDFKRAAVKRMEAGESSAALSRELAVKRTLLYRWRDVVRRDGEKAFAGRPGRPSKAEILTREHGARNQGQTGCSRACHQAPADPGRRYVSQPEPPSPEAVILTARGPRRFHQFGGGKRRICF